MHWTENSIEDMAFRVATDFADQLEATMQVKGMKQYELAQKVGVNREVISKVFRNRKNLTIQSLVKYAAGLDLNVSIVTYPKNKDRGPIIPDIFVICWEECGKPETFFDLDEE